MNILYCGDENKEFTKRFLCLLNKYHFDCIAPDQDYLNAMCNGKILYLNIQYEEYFWKYAKQTKYYEQKVN